MIVISELEIEVTAPLSNWKVTYPFFVAISIWPETVLRRTCSSRWRTVFALGDAVDLVLAVVPAADGALLLDVEREGHSRHTSGRHYADPSHQERSPPQPAGLQCLLRFHLISSAFGPFALRLMLGLFAEHHLSQQPPMRCR